MVLNLLQLLLQLLVLPLLVKVQRLKKNQLFQFS